MILLIYLPKLTTMRIFLNDQQYDLRATGWGSLMHAAEALPLAVAALQANPKADLRQLATEVAAQLRCLPGTFELSAGRFPVGVIETRVVALLDRPATKTRRMAAKEVARRLLFDTDIGTCRAVGAALRKWLGAPRPSNGLQVWDVPDVWG